MWEQYEFLFRLQKPLTYLAECVKFDSATDTRICLDILVVFIKGR